MPDSFDGTAAFGDKDDIRIVRNHEQDDEADFPATASAVADV